MPAAFDKCVSEGGAVRTVSGPNKEHGLKEGEYVRYCAIGGKTHRGEVHQKKKATNSGADGVSHQHVRIQVGQDGKVETRKWNGRDHLVVPAIMLVEGVLHSSNADHPALALSEEFGIFPQSWDGRPIVFGHPNEDGEAISANSPGIWEDQVIGHLFGSGMKGKKKLRTYMWLDKAKAPKKELEALEKGEAVEVSTGLYALEERTEGQFEGKDYKSIWRNIVPDHLALLPLGSVGACSIADGCGAPRVNTTVTNSTNEAPMAQAQPQQNCAKCEELIQTNTLKALKSFFAKSGLQTNELSDTDKRSAVEMALSEAYDGNGWCMILAMFSDTVVYAHMDPQSYKWEVYQRTYLVAEGGAITLGSDITEVRAETKYVPLVITVEQTTTNSEGIVMSKPNEAVPSGAQPAAQPVVPATPVQAPAATPAAAPIVAAAVDPKKAKSLAELMEMAEPDVKTQLQAIIKVNTDRAAALIKSLEGKVGLDANELKNFSLEQLEKMATKLNGGQPIDYSGAGGGSVAANAAAAVQGADQLDYTPATPVFALNEPAPAKQKAA